MSVWDDLAAEISDAGDREAIKGIAGKHPQFAKRVEDGMMRQEDYNRRLNEFTFEKKKLEDQVSPLAKAVKGWEGWRDENWVDLGNGQGKTKHEIALEQQLEAAIEGGDVDLNTVWTDFEKRLKDGGYVSKTDPALVKQEDLRAAGASQMANTGFLFTRIIPMARQAEHELGRPLSVDEFANLTEHLVGDPDANLKDDSGRKAALDRFMAPIRSEQQVTQRKAELAELDKQIEAKKNAAIEAAPQPSDSQAGNVPAAMRDHFLGRKAGEGADPLEGAKLGQGVLAEAGLQAWKEGKLRDTA